MAGSYTCVMNRTMMNTAIMECDTVSNALLRTDSPLLLIFRDISRGQAIAPEEKTLHF